MSLRFEVLGFAGAAPLVGACPAYLVTGGRTTVLLDCGPGSLERLWRAGIDRVDAIVISHMHADHVLDLLPLAGQVVTALRAPRRIPMHVPRDEGPAVLDRLDAAFARSGASASRFDTAFDVRQYDAADRLTIGDLRMRFAPTAHPGPCFAARVEHGAATVVYGADGGPSDAVAELGAGAGLLVLEATFLDDTRAAAEHGHMTARQAGVLAARAGASELLLTHLLPGARALALRSAAAEGFAGVVHVAREGLVWRSR